MDEFGFSFAELLATTWAPRGQRPVLKRIKKERRLVSTAVGLSLSGKIYKRHFTGSIKSPQVIRFLQHLLQFFPKGFILIWDRARIHTSKVTLAFLAEHPEILQQHFPAYAPELNPEEYCHGNIKQHLRNATFIDADQIIHALDNEFSRLRRRPDLITSFFHAAGIYVN
jgi:transposase